jgi:hypothetical protein
VGLEDQLHKVQNEHELAVVAVVLSGSHIVDVGLDQNHDRQLEGGVDCDRSLDGTPDGGADRDPAHKVVVVHDQNPEVGVGCVRGQLGCEVGDMVDDHNRDRLGGSDCNLDQ